MNERIKELAARADAYADTVCMSTETLPDGQTWTTLRDEKFAELIVQECMELNSKELSITAIERLLPLYEEHFGVEEPQGWVCPKCGTDRTQSACPRGHTAALTGDCPMYGVAQ